MIGRKRSALVVAVAALATALAPVQPTAARPPSERAAIAHLLDVRARAVLGHDRAAFMSTVLRSSKEFARRQARLYSDLQSVPLARYRLVANWERYGDLARPKDRALYPDADLVAIPVTEEHYAIANFDGRAALEDLFYTYVRVHGAWKIASDTDVDDLGFDTARHLWDSAPVDAHRSGRFLVMSHPCTPNGPCAHLPPHLTSFLGQAVARVDSFWSKWHHRIIVVVPSTGAELKRMLQATFNIENFVAFAYSTVEDASQGLGYGGPRIVLNWRTLEDRSASSLLAIVAHEMLHVSTRSASGPFVPTWAEEGFADFVGYAGDPSSLSFLASKVTAGFSPSVLPKDYQFITGSGEQIYTSYQEAESAVRFFVLRWGLAAWRRFYRSLGARRIEWGTSRYQVDRSLRTTIGIGLRAFQQAWASSLHA